MVTRNIVEDLVNPGDVDWQTNALNFNCVRTQMLHAGGISNIIPSSSIHIHYLFVGKNADQPSQKVARVTCSKLSIYNIIFNPNFPDGVTLISLVPPENAANHVGVQLTIGHIEDKAKVVIDFRRSGLNLEGVIKNKNFNDFIQKKAIAYLWDETEKADATSQFVQFPVIGINVLEEELVTILGDNDLL